MALPKVAGIYAITNILTGEQYIGGSKNIHKRWQQHQRDLRDNVHAGKRFTDAWHQYGADAFEWSIIEQVPADFPYLRVLEQVYIEEYKPAYNSIQAIDYEKWPYADDITLDYREERFGRSLPEEIDSSY